MTDSSISSYPKEILPNPKYKFQMDVDGLLAEYPDLLVVRLVEGSKDECVALSEHNDLEVKTTVFQNNMANLSLNLAGGLFDTNSDAHLRFLPVRGVGTESWNKDEMNPYSLEPDSYRVCEQCWGLCFFVRNLHGQFFPFYKGFGSKEERDLYERNTIKAIKDFSVHDYDSRLVGEFEGKSLPVRVMAGMKVRHQPTNANYWHMTLDTYRPGEENFVTSENRKNSDKKMFTALKSYLVQHCEIDIEANYRIDPCHYME